MSAAIRHAIIAIFLCCIFYVAYQTIQHPTIETTERRTLAKFPKSPDGYYTIQEYFKGIDAWANDRMHFRQDFITQLTHARLYFGIKTFRSVFVGKDNWLFYNNEREDEDARGSTNFTHEELERWKSYLIYRNAEVEKYGGKYIFVMLPNKSTIYPEYLPDNFTRLSSNTRMQQLVDVMKDAGVVVVDAREIMFAGKKSGQLYLKNDTHWNMLGANYAQYQIMQEIAKIFPDIHPQLFPFHIASAEERDQLSNPNDLYNILTSEWLAPVDTDPNMPVVEGLGKCVGKNDPANIRKHWPLAVGDCSQMTTAQNDPIWFGLLNNNRIWKNLEQSQRDFLFKSTLYEQGQHSLFVAHDSYFEMLQPYFCNTFKHAYYSFLGGRYEMWIWTEILQALHPDVVIEESLERLLKFNIPKAE